MAHEVGGYNIVFKLIDGWGLNRGEMPSVVFGRVGDVTLAQKVDALLEHLGLEVIPGPKVIVQKKLTSGGKT